MSSQPPVVLAIDTSCDDTAVAVTQGVRILSNIVASQVELHKQFGGVFPTVAKQAHRENLPATTQLALRRAGVEWSDIQLLAVTRGPGLAPALEVGLAYAHQLAHQYTLPILPINHIEGHLLSPLAQPHPKRTSPLRALELADAHLPQPKHVLGLVISGGHSEFIMIDSPGKYRRLGWTIDDAAGEVLDKVGRMLGLGYPAGPVIEQFAKQGNAAAYPLPLPMTTSGDFNLSFSGLKTFSRNLITRLEADHPLTKHDIYDLCASLQAGIFRAITYKLEKILKTHPDITEVWLGGGVAANVELRRVLRRVLHPHGLSLHTPYSKRLCADNAAMIGVAAAYHSAHTYLQPTELTTLTGNRHPLLDRQPRWEVDES